MTCISYKEGEAGQWLEENKVESPDPAGSSCLQSPLYSISPSSLALPAWIQCAPGQSPTSPLRSTGGDTARIISQSKGPMWEEACRPEGGERHLLWSQSSFQKQCREKARSGGYPENCLPLERGLAAQKGPTLEHEWGIWEAHFKPGLLALPQGC